MKSTEQPLWWYFVSLWKECSIFIRKHCFTEIWRYAKIANLFPKAFEEDVSFEWSSHRIASTDSKVRTTYKINNTLWKYCWRGVIWLVTPLRFCPLTDVHRYIMLKREWALVMLHSFSLLNLLLLLFSSSQETFSSRDTGMKQEVNQLFSRLKSGTLV